MIRDITLSDVEFLTAPKDIDFADCYSASQTVSAINSPNFMGSVVEADGEKAGYILANYSFEQADIECVYVYNGFRKRGLAKALIDNLLGRLKLKGVTKVFLEVRESNIPAITLYSKCGFNQISVRKKYYNGVENALIFLKEI